jgi:hypothetical protein
MLLNIVGAVEGRSRDGMWNGLRRKLINWRADEESAEDEIDDP